MYKERLCIIKEKYEFRYKILFVIFEVMLIITKESNRCFVILNQKSFKVSFLNRKRS